MGLTYKKKITPMIIYWFTILILTYSISSLNIVEPANFEKDQHKNLEYPIYFQQPIFTETHIENTSFTQITIPDCISNAQPGHPILPTKSIRIIIPYNSDISTITATPDFSQSISYTHRNEHDQPTDDAPGTIEWFSSNPPQTKQTVSNPIRPLSCHS